jgi:hypothetical protein
MMRDLFKSDFIYDVFMKPSKIIKGTGVRMNGQDYMFLSVKIHSFGALTEIFGIQDITVWIQDITGPKKRKASGELVKTIILHNIFTGEEEIYNVDGTSEGFEYIN